ncbi:MAG TPA: hypothetical protein VFZ36_11205 [Vicinamibacterales bacterium]
MTRSRIALEFDRYQAELGSLEPLHSRDSDAWARESRAVCWRHRNRLRAMWGLPLEPALEPAESADAASVPVAVSAPTEAELPEIRGKASGMALALPGAMTIEELERKMEARFSAMEKRISDESIETRRHFNVAAERVEAQVKIVAEGYDAHGKALEDHEKRLTRLERR